LALRDPGSLHEPKRSAELDFLAQPFISNALGNVGIAVRGTVVEEDGSTLVIGPGGTAKVAASGNLIVTLS